MFPFRGLGGICYLCPMQALNFPQYSFRAKNNENKPSIFDVVRKKFVRLTPEEWVRQHVVHHLQKDLGYPLSLINVERKIAINGTIKRYDIVVYQPDGGIHLMVECKAPQIKISQQTFDQIARYNLELRSKYLMVTNGLEHYYCTMDYEAEKYNFLREIPAYRNL